MNWAKLICDCAEGMVGVSEWKWGAYSSEAPKHVDCSSLTQWVFSRAGIWLPRRPYQQYEFCREQGRIVTAEQIQEADLLFVNCPCSEHVIQEDAIGHVGVAISDSEIVCASNSELGRGVVRLAIKQVLLTRTLCGVGRIYL